MNKTLLGCFLLIYMMGGILNPYISAELSRMGMFNHTQIGLIIAIANLCAAISPLSLGRLTDEKIPIHRAIQVFTVCTCGFTLILVAAACQHPPSGLMIIGSLLLLYTARAPVFSLLDTMGMHLCAGVAAAYSRLRLAGSLGAMLATLIGGAALASPYPTVYFPLVALLAIIGMLAGLWIPEISTLHPNPRQSVNHQDNSSFWQSLDYSFLGWLAAMMLHWFAFSPYQYGLTLYMQEQTINPHLFGIIWSIGVLAEIVFFATCGPIFQRFSYQTVSIIALTAALLRWVILGFFPQLLSICLSQLLHGPSFALFYAASMATLAKRGKFLSSYQGLFTTCVTGLSACAGTALTGFLHEHMSFREVFICMIPVQGLAIILLLKNSAQLSYQSSPSSSSVEDS